MNILLVLAFLFFIGSILGWIMEVLFRRFISDANKERKWINPGLLIGPYLPLYGVALCVLYLLALLEQFHFIDNPLGNKLLLFAVMTIFMTLIEYITGALCLKLGNIRLWDYRDKWGNIKGIICPEFSLIWGILGAVYYFLIHPHILDALAWLSRNLVFSFFIGLFFGVFLIDLVYSTQLANKIRRYATENDVIVKYETLKDHIRLSRKKRKQRFRFLFLLRSDLTLNDYLNEAKMHFESRRKKYRKKGR